MALNPGTRLGPYEILCSAGVGGMGEVYRARDTRLDRTVAIKVLPQHLGSSVELKQRFEREARAISQLQHPHICVLYDVGSDNGTGYLVMEYLEGETLAERIRKGPLPLDQLLKIGIEIADALDKAHRSGIIHRDLKPANIMLTKSGAKLMDFGLARGQAAPAGAAASAQSGMPSFTAAATMSHQDSPLTGEGTVLGTLNYMSPEQIEGKEADARSDIFAFGCVLYEMATGKRAFEGKSHISVASAILEKEPEPISALQPTTPPDLDRTIRTCLAKEADARFQTAHDVGLQLKWISEGTAAQIKRGTGRTSGERPWILAACGCALLAITAVGVAAFFSQRAEGLRRVVRTQVGAPEHNDFLPAGLFNHNIVSPDGSMIAFIAGNIGTGSARSLWLRPLGADAAQPLAGTAGASYPFWSPDSKSIGFFANGKLKKVDVSGGVVQNLCDAPHGRGGTWNRDGVILFAPNFIRDAIYRVSDGGGQPSAVTKTGGSNRGGRWPYFLPDGRHFLFSERQGWSDSKVFAASLDSSEVTQVLDENTNAEYANGHLLFVKDGNLVAQPFDLARLRVTGNPFAIASNVEYYPPKGLGNFSISQNGLLVYRAAFPSITQYLWLDRFGKRLNFMGEPGHYGGGRLSPDGRTLVVSRPDAAKGFVSDLWLLDIQGGSASRFTFHPLFSHSAAWSPDGTRLAIGEFQVPNRVLLAAANGSGDPVVLINNELMQQDGIAVSDWSPDGNTLLLNQQNSATGWDILTMPISGKAQPTFLVRSPFNEQDPVFSPDGHWVAYGSDESGRYEVYVIPFPSRSGRWQVSNGTGTTSFSIAWSRDGKQLYYLSPDSALMAADVQSRGNEFHASTPRQIFSAPGGIEWINTAPDGRILVRIRTEQQNTPPMTVVLNWDQQVKN